MAISRKAKWSIIGLGACLAIGLVVALGAYAVTTLQHEPAAPTSVTYQHWVDPGPRLAPGSSQPPSVLERVTEATPTSAASTQGSGDPEPAAPVEISIPAIGVQAPVVTLGIGADGNMASPSSPEEVAWYDFTALPGERGNAVFSGHVDWRTSGPAVFWDLEELEPGDEIVVGLADGTTRRYELASSRSFDASSIPMDMVLERTSTPSITLITCDGSFVNGSYTHRLVVRAIDAEGR